MFSHRLISDNPVFRQFARTRGLEVGMCTPVQFMEALVTAVMDTESMATKYTHVIEPVDSLAKPVDAIPAPSVPTQVASQPKRGKHKGK